MRFITLIILFLSLSFNSYSQPPNSDSLNSVLDTISNLHDKIMFCMNQGDVYMNTDLESFEYWYYKGMKIAKGTEEEYMIVTFYAYLSYEYSERGDYERQAELIHKGKSYINETTPFKNKRAVLSAEANYYENVEQLETAIEINSNLVEMAKEENDSVSLSAALHNLGICYYKQKESLKADSLIKEAYVINNIIGQTGYAINNLSMLANIQNRLGNSQKALEYDLESKQKFTAINDLSGITFINSNIAEDYWLLGNKKMAYAHIDTAITLATKYEFKKWLWISYLRKSSYFEGDGDYKNALKYYKMFSDAQHTSVNEQSASKMESITAELNESKLEILEQNKALQEEQIKVQDEKIKSQKHENAKNRIQLYFLIAGLILLAAFGFFVYSRLKLSNKQKKIIEEQKHEVQSAYEKVAEKNRDITDSINYAKRIQNAMLPTDEALSTIVQDQFVLFKPKDLVSGDFYWTTTANNHTFIAVADCTGHGVPGALVSVICFNALNRSVNEFNLIEPGDILNKTREIVIEQFAKSNEDVNDGMDIALCVIENTTKKLKFAGANNPLWIVRNEEIVVTKADKQPIGNHANLKSFQTHEIETVAQDKFYIFSDGYADQFGGEKGKKFKSKSLAKLLIQIKDTPITNQAEKLDLEFEKWRGNYEQLDDVCLLGFSL